MFFSKATISVASLIVEAWHANDVNKMLDHCYSESPESLERLPPETR